MDFVHFNILLTIAYNVLFYLNFPLKCEENALNVRKVS